MLTVGVDLAVEPANTAVARIGWAKGRAEVQALTVGADDELLVQEIGGADKAGIDCPLGWPQLFVEFSRSTRPARSKLRWVSPGRTGGATLPYAGPISPSES